MRNCISIFIECSFSFFFLSHLLYGRCLQRPRAPKITTSMFRKLLAIFLLLRFSGLYASEAREYVYENYTLRVVIKEQCNKLVSIDLINRHTSSTYFAVPELMVSDDGMPVEGGLVADYNEIINNDLSSCNTEDLFSCDSIYHIQTDSIDICFGQESRSLGQRTSALRRLDLSITNSKLPDFADGDYTLYAVKKTSILGDNKDYTSNAEQEALKKAYKIIKVYYPTNEVCASDSVFDIDRFGWAPIDSEEKDKLYRKRLERMFTYDPPIYSANVANLLQTDTCKCNAIQYYAEFSAPYKGFIVCHIMPKSRRVGADAGSRDPDITYFVFKYDEEGEIDQVDRGRLCFD